MGSKDCNHLLKSTPHTVNFYVLILTIFGSRIQKYIIQKTSNLGTANTFINVYVHANVNTNFIKLYHQMLATLFLIFSLCNRLRCITCLKLSQKKRSLITL